MKIAEKIFELTFKEIIGHISIMTLLAAIASFGIFSMFATVKQSALFALIALGAIGLAEHAYRNRKADFDKFRQLLKSLQGDDSEAFLKFSDRVFGVGKWQPQFEDISVGGLIFRRVVTDKPSPFQALAGPLCPACKKPLDYRMLALFPWAIRFDCLCGFNSIKLMHPQILYKKVRKYFNLPE